MRFLYLLIGAVIAVVSLLTFFLNSQTSAIFPAEEIVTGQSGIVLGAFEKAAAAGFKNSLPVIYSTLPAAEAKPALTTKFAPFLKVNAGNLILAAKAAAAIDSREIVLFDQFSSEQLPVASITKLATALLFLELNPDWDEIYDIKAADITAGGRLNLAVGDRVTVKDLFYLSLVASDNTAVRALVNSTGLTENDFVDRMNLLARELGLVNTKFFDPIGLSQKNVSTALEIAKLAKAALEKEDIASAAAFKKYEFKTQAGRRIIAYSTNALLNSFPQEGIKIAGGKTGFIEAAGYCFVGKFFDEKNEIITVVLGAKDSRLRFSETEKLVKWIYANFIWE